MITHKNNKMGFVESMEIMLVSNRACLVRDLEIGTTVLTEGGEAAVVVKLTREEFYRDRLCADGVARFHPTREHFMSPWMFAGMLNPNGTPATPIACGQHMYEIWLDRGHCLFSPSGRSYLTRGHGIVHDPVASHSILGAPLI
jgi:hypothetical protein